MTLRADSSDVGRRCRIQNDPIFRAGDSGDLCARLRLDDLLDADGGVGLLWLVRTPIGFAIDCRDRFRRSRAVKEIKGN